MMNGYDDEEEEEFLITYRLVDGSYVIAEEIDSNEESCVIYVSTPLELIRTENGGCRLVPWMMGDDDTCVELNANNIIARGETNKLLTRYYYKYIAYDRILRALTEKEDDNSSFNNDIDELDKLDSLEDFWKKLEKPNRWNLNFN